MIVSEQQLPPPAIKLTATYGSISRKDIDEAIAEVQESSNISDGAKNVLAKASKLLAAVPALSHPSAAPEATASPTDLATTDANIEKPPPLSEAPPMPKLPSKIIQLDPISQCQEAKLTASAARVASGNQQHSFAFAPAPAPLAATTTTTSSQGSNEKPATVSASETENAQSLSATSSPRDGDDSDSDDDSDSGEEEVVEEGTFLSSGQYHVHQTEREMLEKEAAMHQVTSATVRIAELEQERDEALQMVEEMRSDADKVDCLLKQETEGHAETKSVMINMIENHASRIEAAGADKAKLEQQLEGLDEIATLRAKLAAFELEDQLPPGWVSGVFSVFNIHFIVR